MSINNYAKIRNHRELIIIMENKNTLILFLSDRGQKEKSVFVKIKNTAIIPDKRFWNLHNTNITLPCNVSSLTFSGDWKEILAREPTGADLGVVS